MSRTPEVPAFEYPPLMPFCVMNVGLEQSVTVYKAEASGNTPPIATITSDSTYRDGFFIASGPGGRIYVANGLGGPADWGTIAIYAAGANGNVAPAQSFYFNSVQDSPAAIAVDASGSIYLTNEALDNQTIRVFAAGSNGNAAPIRTIQGANTRLLQSNGIAVDSAGAIYVVNYWNPCSVCVYAPNANGNAAPVQVIEGPNTGLAGSQGIAIDEAGRIYVRNTDYNSVTVYAKGSNGDVPPVATIQGNNTGIFGDGTIAVTPGGSIYLTNAMGGRPSTVTVYRPGMNGDLSPTFTLVGSATGLGYTEGIALLPDTTANSGCLSLLFPFVMLGWALLHGRGHG